MKFRMFTDVDGKELAVNVDAIESVEQDCKCAGCFIFFRSGESLNVAEDFQTVFSRLNTVAE